LEVLITDTTNVMMVSGRTKESMTLRMDGIAE
jgi:hypothetical protein